MVTGKTYVFFVPPGWLIAGTVDKVEGGVAYLNDACYMESVADNQSLVGDVALADTAEQMKAICTRSWPLPDGTEVQVESMFLKMPCKRDVKPLARGKAAETIKKAGR